MNEDYYSKFIKFLKDKKIYEKESLDYYLKKTTFIEMDNGLDNVIGHCTCVYGKKGQLLEFIPCAPFIKDDKSVIININAYVQTLMLIPKKGKQGEEDVFYNYVLPLFYEQLYILENSSEVLLKYKKNKRKKILKSCNPTLQFA